MHPTDPKENVVDAVILDGELVTAEPGTDLVLSSAQPAGHRPQVEQLGLIRTGAAGSFAHFEFSGTSNRAPERRELAIQLAAYHGLTPVRHAIWTRQTEETGHELVDGKLRATSRTTEKLELRSGRGRTDLELTGELGALAAFAEVLPDALDVVDRLSATGSRLYARQLKTLAEADYLMTSREQPAAVTRWRKEFRRVLSTATGRRATPVELVLRGEFLHRREEQAAATALAALGPRWLENPRRALEAIGRHWLENPTPVVALGGPGIARPAAPAELETAAGR
ncbi:hypothetical protein ACFRMQ_00055 [Kitasatospora sp. NPDC056783]|uniref:hypothetical protein n=1 Tax=Kitasatospora sp. NPDC056783 TaxID=3345943 RepID=UPI003684548E